MKKMMNYLELITIILYGAIPVSLIVAFIFGNANIFMYTVITFAVVYWIYGIARSSQPYQNEEA